MKHWIIALIILLGHPIASPGQQSKQPISKDAVLKAIALFREEPASEQGRGAASIILRYGQESAVVEVVISPKFLPWLGAKPTPKHSDTLMAAYLAGTTRAQLESGRTKNDAVAGTEQVIETYQKLKISDPSLRIPDVEKFIQLKAQGKLAGYLNAK